MANNPQDLYRRQSVLTASPLELIVMLYEGLIKNLVFAKRAIARSETVTVHAKLVRAQDIVTELINSLDLGISMSADLMKIYEYILRELQVINVKKDPQMIDPIIDIVSELADAWRQVSASAKDGSISDMDMSDMDAAAPFDPDFLEPESAPALEQVAAGAL